MTMTDRSLPSGTIPQCSRGNRHTLASALQLSTSPKRRKAARAPGRGPWNQPVSFREQNGGEDGERAKRKW